MNTIISQVPWWFIDFQLSATVLLGMVLIGLWATRQPAQRVGLGWAAALALMALFMAAALPVWPRWHSVNPVATTAAAPAQKQVLGPAFGEPAPARTEAEYISAPARARSPSAATVPEPAASTSIALWMARVFPLGAVAAGLWLLLGMVEAIWLVGTARPAPPELLEQLRAVAPQRAPSTRLLLSNHVNNAVALGAWRPAILLPAALAEHAGEKSLRAVLAHEAAHIANRDLWLLGLMRGLMVVLFPHPFYWMIRRSIRNGQEALADAVAAQSRETDYAEGLVEWVRQVAKPRQILAANAAGIWEGPLDLSRRISLLLNENFTVQTRLPRRWRLGVAVCVGTVALGLSLFTVRPASAEGFRHAKMLATDSPSASLTDGVAILIKGDSEYTTYDRTNGEPRQTMVSDFELLRHSSGWKLLGKNVRETFPLQRSLASEKYPDYGTVAEFADDGTNVYIVSRGAFGKMEGTEYRESASIMKTGARLPLPYGSGLVLLFLSAYVTNSRVFWQASG